MFKWLTLFIVPIVIISVYKRTDRYPTNKTLLNEIDPFYQGHGHLSIHFYSSPFGIDWSSPQQLLVSSLKNAVSPFNRIISHVAIEVQSYDGNFYRFTSMSDTSKDLYKRLLSDQVGLGLLLAEYPGTLENPHRLQPELSAKKQSGRVQTVSYLLSKKTIDRIEKYLIEYKEKKQDRVYSGLDKHPRYLEGAGCMAFSHAVSEIAGLDTDKSQSSWDKDILIPMSLIGPPHTKHKVSMLKFFSSKDAQSWAKSSESHIKITFWDIDKIYKDVKELKLDDTDFKLRKVGRSHEVLYDRTNLQTPDEPFWLERKNTIN